MVGVSQPGVNVEMDGTVAVADGEEGRVLVIVELPAALGPAAGDAAGAAAAEGGDSEGGEEDRWSTAVPGGTGGGGVRGDAALEFLLCASLGGVSVCESLLGCGARTR